ncbi:hypothetical protein V8J88_00425 [Massilia sp. W12]|uniref:hypothetical protein n=1 Tax=Massilia sp. W12 TaxID=3126507 RepID=UPI0030D3431A
MRLKPLRKTCLASFLIAASVLIFVPAKASEKDATATYKETIEFIKEHKISAYYKNDSEAALVFFGSRHTFNSGDPQLKAIENFFALLKPTLVLTEGGRWPVAKDKVAAITAYSEMGFLTFLAHANEVKFDSLDLDYQAQVNYALKRHDPLDVSVYTIIRLIPQWRDQYGYEAISRKIDQYLANEEFKNTFPLNTGPKNFNELKAYCAQKFPDVKNILDFDYHLTANGIQPDVLMKVSASFSEVRDAYMEKKIMQEIEKGERVFAIAGTPHLAKIVPNLLKKYSN